MSLDWIRRLPFFKTSFLTSALVLIANIPAAAFTGVVDPKTAAIISAVIGFAGIVVRTFNLNSADYPTTITGN